MMEFMVFLIYLFLYRHILQPQKIKIGDKIENGSKIEIKSCRWKTTESISLNTLKRVGFLGNLIFSSHFNIFYKLFCQFAQHFCFNLFIYYLQADLMTASSQCDRSEHSIYLLGANIRVGRVDILLIRRIAHNR